MEKLQVKRFIEQEHLLDPHAKVLVALSGGADSVALLHLLIELGYTCEAAHCNFHLRGKESDRDEQFVRSLCATFSIPLHVIHFNTKQVAESRHISLEMAARELRYAWFEELRVSTQAEAIAVAHHQDDSAETFLLNLVRGTGIQGLRGIRPKNGHIIRPLLTLTRANILDYLKKREQNFMTDSTNLQDDFMRNKIRLNVLPLLQSINPSVQESILRTAHYLDEAAVIYQQAIEESKKWVMTDTGIHIERLLKEPAPETLLHEIVYPLGFNASQIHDIFQSLTLQSGKLFLSTEYRLLKDREILLIEKKGTISKPAIHCETFKNTPDFIIPREKHIACFDADKLNAPLTLRLWQQGDTFVPFGMKGKKKVSDYLTDRKFSRFQKEQQWVLCCGNDIIWLIDERTDNRYRIEASTQKILMVKKAENEDSIIE